MRLSALSTVAYVYHKQICDVTSSNVLGRFMSRKSEKGGGGLVHQKGENRMTMSGHRGKNPSVEPFLETVLLPRRASMHAVLKANRLQC